MQQLLTLHFILVINRQSQHVKLLEETLDFFGTDCVNQAFGGEEHPFFEGDGNEMDHALYVPSSVEITYKICNQNFDSKSPLILDQEKTQLKYDSQALHPT